ncbi:GNAT family N-acetyltransferase [Photobacterium salinisoli]|uniref:GNAT family N-acetyltransferase n=1 Tax=Photobacterium salinisoli TaxID=1616783 RepID=UPI000EA07FBD|nr:GNAT family N-acetyltransferase [Photobacterium salinisoli]
MDTSLRRAVDEDLEFLISLRDKTMRQHLLAVGMPISREEYVKRILFEFDHAQIVELEGTPIGLFKAKFDEALNYWYIIQIQIEPSYQGLQIGSRLIQGLIEQARRTGASVGLSVIKTNPAKHLYLRLGFNVVDESGVEHLMELQF